MAKLTVLLASFALCLLVANASIYCTTVESEDENPSRGQSCQEQIQQQQQLRNCQRFMRQKARQEESWGSRDNQQQQHFRQCCQELQRMDARCRCLGLEQAARSQQQQMRGQGMEAQLYETASNIPQW